MNTTNKKTGLGEKGCTIHIITNEEWKYFTKESSKHLKDIKNGIN